MAFLPRPRLMPFGSRHVLICFSVPSVFIFSKGAWLLLDYA